MAVTEVRLGPSHLAGCVGLSASAGWNQNAADWRLMLERGEGWGLAATDGTLVASTLVLPYGHFAWISMVLVLPAHRRQGHATGLLRTALAHLEARGLIAALDATPAGREVYRQVGFRDTWSFTRYVLNQRIDRKATAVRPLQEHDWPWVLELDRSAFGGDRSAVLRALAARLPDAALVVEGKGYVLGRDGREARQIGPLIATQTSVAQSLLDAAAAAVRGPVYLDLADHARLERDGLVAQRPFTRMVRGAPRAPGETGRVFLVAGPELG